MMAIDFKGAHFPPEVILMGVRWYVAYPLSTRHVEELMEERGVEVDHATINRWVIKYSPQLEEAFHRRKRAVWVIWRMDETYIKVKGQWRYLYCVVDKHGQTIDFLLTEHRDKEAALRFLKKAIRRNGLPETITIDGSDANEAAIKRYNEGNRSGGPRYAAIGRSSSASGRHGRSDGAGSPVYAAWHASVREARTLRCCCLSVATTVIIASTNCDLCVLCVPKLSFRHKTPG